MPPASRAAGPADPSIAEQRGRTAALGGNAAGRLPGAAMRRSARAACLPSGDHQNPWCRSISSCAMKSASPCVRPVPRAPNVSCRGSADAEVVEITCLRAGGKPSPGADVAARSLRCAPRPVRSECLCAHMHGGVCARAHASIQLVVTDVGEPPAVGGQLGRKHHRSSCSQQRRHTLCARHGWRRARRRAACNAYGEGSAPN